MIVSKVSYDCLKLKCQHWVNRTSILPQEHASMLQKMIQILDIAHSNH